MTHEDDDDSATRQRAMAGGRAVATTGVQVNAYAAVEAAVCLRACEEVDDDERGRNGGNIRTDGVRERSQGKNQLGNHASVVKSPVIHREIVLPFSPPRTAIRRVCTPTS